MAYRESSAQRSGEVIHGPFPVRLGYFAGGLASVAMGVLFGLLTLDYAELSCQRSDDTCTYVRSRWFGKAQRFRLSSIDSVEVKIETGSKNTTYGRPHLRQGKRLTPLKRVSVDDAHRFRRDLTAAIEGKKKGVVLRLRESFVVGILALGLLAFGAFMFVFSLRGIGRIRLRVASGQLHVTRTIIGLVREHWEIDLNGVRDVDIQWDRIRSWVTRRGHPGETAATLVLHLANGSTHVITPRPYRGYHLHLRAERALRELLDLNQRTDAEQARFDERAASFAPPPVMGGGVGAKIGLAWIGMCCGSLIGLCLLGIALLSLGIIRGGDPLEDWTLAAGLGSGAILGILAALALARRAESR